MTPARRQHRADSNQAEIVNALRQVGCSVEILSQVGSGCPDLMVGKHGITMLLEVKQPNGELSTEQIIWHGKWQGHVAVVRSVDEAIAAVNKAVRGFCRCEK